MTTEFKLFEQRILSLAKEMPGLPWQEILLGKMVRHLHQQNLDEMNSVLEPFGLHWGTWLVMITLYSAPDMYFTPSDMADMLHVTRTNATRLLDELEQRKLVTRVQCHNDRRKVFLALTDEARELILQIKPSMWDFHRESWSPLSPGEMQLMDELLRKLLSRNAAL